MVSFQSPAGQVVSVLDADARLLLSLLTKQKRTGTLSNIFKREPMILAHALKSLDDDDDVLYKFLCKHRDVVGKFLEQHKNISVLADFLARYPAAMHQVLDEERSIAENFLAREPDALHIYLDANPEVLENYLKVRPKKFQNQVRNNLGVLDTLCDDDPQFRARWLRNKKAAVQDTVGNSTAGVLGETSEDQATVELSTNAASSKDVKVADKDLDKSVNRDESPASTPGLHEDGVRRNSDPDMEDDGHLDVQGRKNGINLSKSKQQDSTLSPAAQGMPSTPGHNVDEHRLRPISSSKRRSFAKGDSFQAPHYLSLGDEGKRTRSHASSRMRKFNLHTTQTKTNEFEQDDDIMPSIELDAHELHSPAQSPLLRGQRPAQTNGTDNEEPSDNEPSSVGETGGDYSLKRRVTQRSGGKTRRSYRNLYKKRYSLEQEDNDFEDESDDLDFTPVTSIGKVARTANTTSSQPRRGSSFSSKPRAVTPWRPQSTTNDSLTTTATPGRLAIPYPAPPELLAAEGDDTRRSGGWTLRQEDAAIRHMLAIRDEGTVHGENRFRLAVNRLNAEFKKQRTWTSFKNFWNRSGRARSGFDERKNRNEILATSLQGRYQPINASASGRGRSYGARFRSSTRQSVQTPSYSPVGYNQQEEGNVRKTRIASEDVASEAGLSGTEHEGDEYAGAHEDEETRRVSEGTEGYSTDEMGVAEALLELSGVTGTKRKRANSENASDIETVRDGDAASAAAAPDVRNSGTDGVEAQETANDKFDVEAYARAFAFGTRQKKKVKYSF